MASAKNSDVARLRSATYSPAASRAWVSSIDFGSGAGMEKRLKERHFPEFEQGPPPRFIRAAYYSRNVSSRRRFLAGALAFAAAPVAAQQKPAAKVYRIGMLEAV